MSFSAVCPTNFTVRRSYNYKNMYNLYVLSRNFEPAGSAEWSYNWILRPIEFTYYWEMKRLDLNRLSIWTTVFCAYYRELRVIECTYYREMTVVIFNTAYRRNHDNHMLRVKMAICAIVSEFTMAWQLQLQVKLAIHGIASELNRIKMKACERRWLLTRLQMNSTAWRWRVSATAVVTKIFFTCESEKWMQPSAASHNIGARCAIESFWPRCCECTSHEIGARYAIEIFPTNPRDCGSAAGHEFCTRYGWKLLQSHISRQYQN